MTQSLSVYVLPGRNDRRWRASIESAAAAAGWLVRCFDDKADQLTANADRPLNDQQSVLTLHAEPPQNGGGGAENLMVHLQPMLDVTSNDDGARADDIRRKSYHLSQCVELAHEGAAVLNGEASRIALPGLGEVSLDAVEDQAGAAEPSLAMYATLPPRIGAKGAWGASLFQCWARRSERPVGGQTIEIDLTGRAGVLISGPHIHLPRGRWMLRCLLEIRPQGRASQLAFDWGDEDCRAYIECSPQEPGLYEVVMEATMLRSWLSEFRVIARDPHIEGSISFSGCDVEYVGFA